MAKRVPLRLRDRSTGDILVLLIAVAIVSVLIGVTAAAITYVFFHPDGRIPENSVRLVADMMNTLIGLLAGFMVGRTRTVVSNVDGETHVAASDNESEYLNTADTEPQQRDERGQVSIGRAMLAESDPTPSKEPPMKVTDQHNDEPNDDLEEVGSHDLILDDGDDDFEIDPDQEDIGTDDPNAEDGTDDPSVFEDTEIDDLPEVGEMDPDEEPELDELEALALEAEEEPRG